MGRSELPQIRLDIFLGRCIVALNRLDVPLGKSKEQEEDKDLCCNVTCRVDVDQRMRIGRNQTRLEKSPERAKGWRRNSLKGVEGLQGECCLD